MKLEKLYYCYGLDTSCFYTDEERTLERRINNVKRLKNNLKAIRDKTYHIQGKTYKKKIKQQFGNDYTAAKKQIDLQFCERWYNIIEQRFGFKEFLHRVNTEIKNCKQKLLDLQNANLDILRTVRYDKIHNRKGEPSMRRRVSIFDSTLTRCLNLKERQFNTEIVIVKVFYFPVAHNILRHGFIMDGQKYVFFSASAGQIRTKKFVAVREDLLNACWNTLTAGLTIERINELGGMNVN